MGTARTVIGVDKKAFADAQAFCGAGTLPKPSLMDTDAAMGMGALRSFGTSPLLLELWAVENQLRCAVRLGLGMPTRWPNVPELHTATPQFNMGTLLQ